MSTPTLQSISIRLSAVDGIGANPPSGAAIPTIETDLNGIHTTIDQLTLLIQSQLYMVMSQLTAVEIGLAGQTVSQTVRAGAYTLGASTLGGPYTVNFPAPYTDGLYTVETTITLGESLSTAGCSVAGVKQQATPGNGISVWVMNSDSIIHTVTVNCFVQHD